MLLFLNLGGSEIFLVVFVILIFFGSKGIPDIAKTMGKAMREFKDATNGIQREMMDGTRQINEEVQKTTDNIKKDSGIDKELM